MNVASLALCSELYKLSDWGSHLGTIDHMWGTDSEDRSAVVTHSEYANGNEKIGIPIKLVPAYDTGYLLRMLPYKHNGAFLNLSMGSNSDIASYRKSVGAYEHTYFRADTPENALCKLAIELFKQGIL